MRGDGVTYVGHACALIEMDGTRLLTDPVLGSRIGHIRRIAPGPPPGACEGIDAILISHAHHDHLDLRSLRRLRADVPVIAPPGCTRLLRRRTRHSVTQVMPGERLQVGNVTVAAVRAEHDGRRFPVGARLPTVGYLVEGTFRVAFFGDTDLFEGMRSLADGLDVALLPVWGWGPRTGRGHLDPARAARAAAMLAADIVVPIHWGTLAGPRVWWRDDPTMPARAFAAFTAEHAPSAEVRILAPGERLALRARSS